MASLIFKISESVNLEGVKYGAETQKSITGVDEFSRRILTTDGTTATTIASFGSVVAGDTYIQANARYVRITNLDGGNYVALSVTLDTGSTAVRLDPGASYLLISTSATGFATYADAGAVSLDNVTAITATANTAACDLEIVVASA